MITFSTKVQVKQEYKFRIKSSKGQEVVIKGIEAEVEPTEVAHALRENGL